MTEFTSFHAPSLSDWKERQREYRDLVVTTNDTGRFSYVTSVLEGLPLNNDAMSDILRDMREFKQDCDMSSMQLVRFLYLLEDSSTFVDLRAEILNLLLAFPFWPSTETRMSGKDVSKLVFWSENHIFMSLGSAHLSRQFKAIQNAKQRIANSTRANTEETWMQYVEDEMATVCASIPGAILEEKLLRHYLEAHTCSTFTGLYETLSHVYLPYTLSALLNLYDFSLDHTLRSNVSALIDCTTQSLLMTTNSSGVSTLTASCRAFDRTRRRNRGHNINNLIRMLVGISPEPLNVSALTDFLCTTSWRPKHALLDSFSQTGRMVLRCSHQSHDFHHVYQSSDTSLNDLELTPFVWSAGLVLHPEFAARTKEYISHKNMTNNATFGLLKFVPHRFAASLSRSLSYLSAGQSYCGVSLNIYKCSGRGNSDGSQVVMTSLDRWNVQKAGFQQLPWCLNFAGVGIWTQSGAGAEGVLGFCLTNTNNPCVGQAGSLLVCSYVAPPFTLSSSVLQFSYESWLVWPDCVFEECMEYTGAEYVLASSEDRSLWRAPWGGRPKKGHYFWRVGRRKDNFVGVLCTNATQVCRRDFEDTRVEVSASELLSDDDSPLKKENFVTVQCARITCRSKAHSWIVVVGEIGPDCMGVEEFYSTRLSKIVIEEDFLNEGVYRCSVSDKLEGEVVIQI